MKKILIQLDTDSHASTFDGVVAVDAGVDHLFSYGDVTPENVTGLVHGAMFTRGGSDLAKTAIFIGGSNIAAGEALFDKVKRTFFGPVCVSVMMDSNGCNTTAAAAVLRLKNHIELEGANILVLAGTGPVGFRVAQLLAAQNAKILLTSRKTAKAEKACEEIRELLPQTEIRGIGFPGETTPTTQLLSDIDAVVACGAAGVQFLSQDEWQSATQLKVVVDINAVPPLGIDGVEMTDKGVKKGSVVAYGALGVGSLKMKIHKSALNQLFLSNSSLLSTTELYAIGEQL